MTHDNPLRQLHALGQSFWWDALSRRALQAGEVARMRDEDGMRGITSNPSIFQQAIAKSTDYDGAIRELAAQGTPTEDMFWQLAIEDIAQACDLLRPVYDDSEAADGYVSLEVNPHLAHDAEGTLTQVRELWRRVDRPNLMIKIPGTQKGVFAIRQALREGHNINVTLLFSPQAHLDVMQAYIEALEARRDAGEPIDRIASVASFFVSRVDTLVDQKLESLGAETADELRGQAGVANAKVAYANFESVFGQQRWRKLAEAGARVQRPLWASTRTKDPRYSDVLYVEDLIGPDTVNTMPTVTLDAYRDHGQPAADRVRHDVDGARALMARLESVGISMRQVTDQLVEEGVEKFEKSFDELLEELDRKASRVVKSDPGSS
jgi:transaldolase